MRGWLADRLGLGESIDRWLDAPVGPASWARAAVVALALCLAVAALSGIGLASVYAPSGASAWASVFFTEFELSLGWLARSLHQSAAEGAVVLGPLALLAWVVEGRYRHRRDLVFACLALALVAVLVGCVSGNPLRWDNRGYFGLLTESNIASEVPLVGRLTRSLLLGGSMPGNWTLPRLYTLHTTVLPVALGLLAAVGLRSARRAGPAVVSDEPAVAYADAQLGRDALVAALTFVALLVVAWARRAPLEAPADPLASYPARPEWYFQWLYVLRNAVPAQLGGATAAGIPLLLGASLLALLRLDRDPLAPTARRARFIAPFALVLAGIAALTVVGLVADGRNPELRQARVAQEKLDRRARQIAHHDGIPPAGALTMMRTDPVLHGEDLFRQHCASCHQLGELGPPDGKLAGPVLDGWGTEAWARAMLSTPDSPRLFGLTPFKGQMPSYVLPPADAAPGAFTPMPEAQQAAIARFLAGEARAEPAGHDPDGEKLVRQRCTSCHLFRGETDDPGGLAPELSGWASLAWTRAQLGNPGTMATYRPASMAPTLPGHMPRLDATLSSSDLDLLTRFVVHRARSLSLAR